MKGSHHLAFGIRHAVFWSAIWWVLSEGVLYQLWFAALVVLAATAASAVTLGGEENTSLRLRHLWSFIPYFIYQTWKGGVEVARRALTPGRSVRPIYIEFRLRIAEDHTLARVIFAACLCIFPGSLSCGIRGDILIVHILDEDLLDEKAIRDLETIVASLLGALPERST